MNIMPLLIVFAVVFACNLSGRLNVAKVVDDAERIRDGEAKFFSERHRYAELHELVQAGLVDEELADGRDAGYVIDLSAADEHYVLSIYSEHPQIPDGNKYGEELSIYCDETGVMRASVDPKKRADAHAERMNPKH
jgi:hypothetical protein